MDFELRIISAVLENADISFDVSDITDIDNDDPERIYFNLNGESGYFVRMWELRSIGKHHYIDYTLYKDNDRNGADRISEGVFQRD